MTPEQLLQERLLVNDGYPDTPYKIGTILYKHLHGDKFVYTLRPEFSNVNRDVIDASKAEKWPNIFKPIKWWENRDIKNMPEYVKNNYTDGFEILKVKEWFSLTVKVRAGIRDSHHVWYPISTLTPATKEEYKNYINTK